VLRYLSDSREYSQIAILIDANAGDNRIVVNHQTGEVYYTQILLRLGDRTLDQGLHRIDGLDLSMISKQLVDSGWQVFILPEGIKDRKSFFDGIRRVVPLDPPVRSDRSWEALSDSLWGGLDSLDEDKVAIIWEGSAEMAKADRDDFEIATGILSDLTKSLGDSDATVGNIKRVLVLLA
jgi:hypothetical protein